MRKSISGMIVAFLFLALSFAFVMAQDWDKSSILITDAFCDECGQPAVVILNHGSPMSGTTTFRWYQTDQPIGGTEIYSGEFQLDQNESITISLPATWTVPVRFEAEQRPGHPGSSEPKVLFTEACDVITPTPTEVIEPTFTPTSTPTATPENTSTPTSTPVDAPTLTPTPTIVVADDPTPTPTPTVEPTVTGQDVTPTPTIPPTALDPVPEPMISPFKLFLSWVRGSN